MDDHGRSASKKTGTRSRPAPYVVQKPQPIHHAQHQHHQPRHDVHPHAHHQHQHQQQHQQQQQQQREHHHPAHPPPPPPPPQQQQAPLPHGKPHPQQASENGNGAHHGGRNLRSAHRPPSNCSPGTTPPITTAFRQEKRRSLPSTPQDKKPPTVTVSGVAMHVQAPGMPPHSVPGSQMLGARGAQQAAWETDTRDEDAIGKRVFARWRDLYLYPGTIKAVRYQVNCTKYSVRFDNQETEELQAHDIVGEGFTSFAEIKLHPGQRLWVWYNQAQCLGSLESVSQERNQVMVALENGDRVRCSLSDVRLEPQPAYHLPTPHPVLHRPYPPDQAYPPEQRSNTPHTPHSASVFRPMQFEFTGPMTHTVAIKTHAPSTLSRSSSMDNGAESHNEDGDLRAAEVLTGMSHGPQDERSNTCSPRGESPTNSTGQQRCIFRCEFSGCGKGLATLTGIKKHIRTHHMQDVSSNADVQESFHYRKVASLDERDTSTPTVEPRTTTATAPSAVGTQKEKCRKRFGIERKNEWCSKCRWKKACDRV